jgi:hypothetical protein
MADDDGGRAVWRQITRECRGAQVELGMISPVAFERDADAGKNAHTHSLRERSGVARMRFHGLRPAATLMKETLDEPGANG